MTSQSLEITHRTIYTYAPDADRAGLRVKLFPMSNAAQSVQNWQVTVNGDAVAPMLTNPFGDGEALWFSHDTVDEIEIVGQGRITMTDTSGVMGKVGLAKPSVFLRPSDLTEPDERIEALTNDVTGDTPLDRMHALNSLVHETVSYRQGATDAETTAAQALAQGAGVCQDLTHVFLAAARVMGLPARYVTGYYLDPEGGAEVETHAWAEVHLDVLGWTGFDPTHEKSPTDGHVRLCSGFDAADASPIRGHILGEIEETMDVTVSINQSQSQSQQ